mmetsp:Transcript_7604/g.27829  ORF Transcript_7604/g.27829 Transcript_7604/m.27829 type:complete len:256 (-) Transcript_7604:7909-8676(-)
MTGIHSDTTKSRVCIFIGLAGSGKSSLLDCASTHARSTGEFPYIMNLDPAATKLAYQTNIDIRDTINYKAVMKEYNLGPNGAILTASNLFATRFDKALRILEARSKDHKWFFVDTPGQIEIFTWSASGMMFTEMFASSFDTVLIYVIDTPRCANPQVLIGNMLQAISVLYRTQLRLIVVFNKIDVAPHEPLLNMLSNFNSFQQELESQQSSFSTTLTQSLNVVLNEFYEHLDFVGVSAINGMGMSNLWEILAEIK